MVGRGVSAHFAALALLTGALSHHTRRPCSPTTAAAPSLPLALALLGLALVEARDAGVGGQGLLGVVALLVEVGVHFTAVIEKAPTQLIPSVGAKPQRSSGRLPAI